MPDMKRFRPNRRWRFTAYLTRAGVAFLMCRACVSESTQSLHNPPPPGDGISTRPTNDEQERTTVKSRLEETLQSVPSQIQSQIQNSYASAANAASAVRSATADRLKSLPSVPILQQAKKEQEVVQEVPRKSENRKYLVVKIVLFLYYGSLGSLMPYLPVYYHSLGITDDKIGQLGAICPAVNFVVSPLWGALADKTGRLKLILLSTFAASVALRCSMLVGRSYAWVAGAVFLTAIVNAPVRPLLDSSVMNMLTHKKDYGRQRLFGQFGFGVFSFLVGPMMARSGLGYRGAFLLHALVSAPTFVMLCAFRPAPAAAAAAGGGGEVATKAAAAAGAKEGTSFRAGLRHLARDGDAGVFFALVFAIGLSSGVIENFAYKRLRELGGGGNVMGVSRLVSSLMGVPMFYFSGNLTKYLSVMGVLMFSMLSYIARFFIYASIKNPWHALPAEGLRGLTFAGMWASATYYAHKIAPPGMEATMLGLLNGIYGGVGQSLGSLIGGGLSSRWGTSKAFYLYGAADIALVGLFAGYWALHPRATQLGPDRSDPAGHKPMFWERLAKKPNNNSRKSTNVEEQGRSSGGEEEKE